MRKTAKSSDLYLRIRRILESARTTAARSVDTTQVMANWLIGREIVEEEQKGERRAEYGEQLLSELSVRLTAEYGKGYSVDNLEYFRRLFLEYPDLLVSGKSDALRRISVEPVITDAAPRKSMEVETWQPGRLHPNLSWTHYRTLLRTDEAGARAFYEIEAIQNCWSTRELERQINSLLYERLALSKDKKGLMRLATKGHEIRRPVDVFKDPVVMEFLGLPDTPRLVESTLQEALLNNLQTFLLELGKGFAFVARQHRLTLDGDHFYVDLVFYHAILKCYVLIDLKVGKLTHQDLGQLQLYVNYFDRERLTAGDNPTLGLILCTDKNEAVVRYTLGEELKKQIFTSRYKLHLPTEAELKAEIRRELKILGADDAGKDRPIRKKRRG